MACEVAQALVIGVGEVGGRLLAAFDRAAFPARGVRRGDDLAALLAAHPRAARIAAVREEALAEVLASFAGEGRGRLALLQNGLLEVVHGDLGGATRGLVWFTSKGEFFRVLAPTLLRGPLAAPLADALRRGGIDAEEVPDRAAFTREMIVKGLWNCVVGLPLAVHGEDLAAYRRARRDEARAILDEGARAAGAFYGVRVDADEAERRLWRTTEELGWMRGGAKALAWRNGAVARCGRLAGVPTPVNDALLRAAGYDPDRAAARP
ncbi:MAG: hypothetical protein ABFD65_02515 [Candidatus Polarisedimenticolia bacterium]